MASPSWPLPPGGGYDASARARRIDEAPKRSQFVDEDRDPFARDRARVLHSSALRRLADKTQVVDPGADEFPRTRLTHSLEVAQIARELGFELGCAPDVVDAAGLAHDLGHPPFGHNGEAVLNELSAQIGGFEGNAQTLRILTRLEPKTIGSDGQPGGLNLTRAVLDATCKYPWPRRADNAKFGVYADDLPAFTWLRDGVPDGRRCLEAQVMDWADDVAYSVHDVEDGVYAGSIRIDALDAAERAEVCALAAGLYLSGPLAMPVAIPLDGALDRLLALPALMDLRGFDRSHAALTAAKRATSELTGRFAGAAAAATLAQAGAGPLTRYDADLTVPREVVVECALLKALAARYVMQSAAAGERRAAQRRLLRELVAALVDAGASALSQALRPSWAEAADDDERLRVVIDQVAQLTDSGAVAAHRRLTRRSD
jgi:dGTPase